MRCPEVRKDNEIKTSKTLTDTVISVLTFQIITSRTVEVIRNPDGMVPEK